MIGELLPEAVVAVEAYGADAAVDAPLYPEERAVVARAVDKRRREFASVRRCARHAMVKLGLEPRPVLPGERGAPLWPEGILGSMTHCTGYCAAALVRAGELASLGIDAEPHEALPEGVLGAVAASASTSRTPAARSRSSGDELCTACTAASAGSSTQIRPGSTSSSPQVASSR